MRELTLEELELVSGGNDSNTIVVVGDGGGDDWGDWGDTWTDNGDWYDPGDYGDGGGGDSDYDPPPPADNEVVEVDVQIDRPLTAEEQKAVDDLKAQIPIIDAAIKALPDNAVLTLPDGSTVTGAELKAAWANTDFVIAENGTSFANGSGRGEANYNGGDPVVSYTIGNLVGYAAHGAAGLNYVVLHEVAHFANAQMSGYSDAYNDADGYTEAERAAHEREANDIARAIANSAGLDILTNPGDGYSTENPGFVTPPPPDGGGGGGGGGGDGGFDKFGDKYLY